MSEFAFALELADDRSPLPAADTPTERLNRLGSSALSDTELVSLLLQGGGASSESAMRTASALIARAGSLATLLSWTPAQFALMGGIGAAKATQMTAMVELGRRILSADQPRQPLMNRADLIADFLRPHVAGLSVEKFYVLSLNRKNRLIRSTAVTSGTATAALAHPREVFRQAMMDSATAIIVAHNLCDAAHRLVLCGEPIYVE